MHHCFLIHEILEMIVQELAHASDDWPFQSDNKSMLAFVLTCRTFCEPGLDALWKRLYSPRPLAFAFRSNIEPVFAGDVDAEFEDDVLIPRDTLLGLSKVPGPADWERFSYYAKRVKLFMDSDFMSDDVDNVHPRFLLELLAYRPLAMPLLPNLHSLFWNNPSIDFFPCISLFLSPTLTTVNAGIQWNANAIRLWCLLRSCTPALQHLSVDCCDFTSSKLAKSAFSEALRTWHNLTNLHLEAGSNILLIAIDNLLFLSQCPKLTDLTLALEDSSLNPSCIPEGFFASLQRLYMRSENMSLMSEVVRAVQCRDFGSVSICCTQSCTSTAVSKCLKAIAVHKQLSKLHVSLDRPETASRDNKDQVVTDETVAPAFALSQLTECRIDVVALRLSKKSLEDMAQSWPKLTLLRLSCGKSSPKPTVVAGDLEIFKTYCPDIKIENIEIPVRKG